MNYAEKQPKKEQNINYHQRLANLKDATVIGPLWEAFLKERTHFDRSLILKPDFDYVAYVKRKLSSPSVYGFLLEYGESKEIVGFLFIYIQDETPTLDFEAMIDSPFQPRRMGGAIGMYVQEEHRRPDSISLLVESAIAFAEDLKINDIDLLLSIEQTGVHKLVERLGFQKAAIQYTKHYEVEQNELPSLPKKASEGIDVKMPTPGLIPLRDPKTRQPVLNPQGEQVFLYPLKDATGKILNSSAGLPIYPTPLRNPQTQDWVFDESSGQLVVCPILLDDSGKIIEHQGIPQFQTPVYDQIDGKLALKRHENGQYLFTDPINYAKA